MKFSFDTHPRLVRILTIAMLAFCLYTGGYNFYSIASVPTDENVFVDAPSSVFIAADIPALCVKEAALKLFDRGSDAFPNALLASDAIISIDNENVRTMADVRRIIDAPAGGDSVDVFVLRASLNTRVMYKAERRSLAPAALVEHANVVVVTSVLPEGASDRAGMKAGDVIYRINEQTFTTAQEADKTLRQGQVDKSLRYDIYRGGKAMSLQVTLAKFGISITVLIFFCIGLTYLGMGVFLALKRPRLIAARLLGWGFIAIGCLLMVISQGRTTDATLLVTLRQIMLGWGFFGGVAFFTHSFFYFPVEKHALLAKRWHVPVLYAVSVLSLIVTLITKNPVSLFGTFSVMFYYMIIRIVNREKVDHAAERVGRSRIARMGSAVLSAIWPKSMMRGVRASIIAIIVLIGSFSLLQGSLGDSAVRIVNIVAFSLLLFPLAYLYTIGRYQLLDMSMRIRRNLQYSALTIVWNTVALAALFVVFFSLPDIALPLQNVEFTGASILITDTPVPASEMQRNEKIVSMCLGLAAVFGYVVARRKGQKFIDEKYYQTQFDYRRALSELSEALAAKLGMSDLAKGLVSTLADLLKVKQAAVLFFRNGDSCCCIESAGKEAGGIPSLCGSDQALLIHALGSVTDSARVEYLQPSLRTVLERMGFCIVLPIRSKEQLIGALLVGEKLSEAAFKDEDISFLNSAAMQASVSIENAFLYEELTEQERMKHELEIARKIQLASLPQVLPQVRGLDIDGASLPAMEVGGDFYDYLETDATKVTVIIGDVSGKGTSAALYMSKVQGILRSLFTFGLSPRDLFIRANRLLCRDLEKRSFVTVLGAEFDLAARTVRIARAGHLPLYCYHAASHAVEKIVPPGIGLGLNDADQPFSSLNELQKELHPGDVYLFVSDGITEAHDEEGNEFGDDLLCAFLHDHHDEPASLVCERLYAEVKLFAGAAPQHDDQTVVCIIVTDH